MFGNKSKKEKMFEARRKMEKLNQELGKMWNEDYDEIPSDVNGSYTGTPKDGGEPQQDADDL
ncbi:MAG: hypothetical protein J1F24_00445 [Oscillospiraceae bacterium]|nr:hypothetical protein [Oscillospiraceae bacterium]